MTQLSLLPQRRSRLLVCGGREFNSRDIVYRVLDALLTPSILIQGECETGADAIAKEWARERGVNLMGLYALWDLMSTAAGPERNTLMLDEGRPTTVLAFPGGRGTANMTHQALERGLEVLQVRLRNGEVEIVVCGGGHRDNRNGAA